MIIFAGVSQPDTRLPGIFGQACFQFQERAKLDGSGGFGTIGAPVLTGK